MQQKKIRFTSPKGYALYAHLDVPDTKFDSDGVYTVNLKLDDTENTQQLINKLEAIRDEYMENSQDVQKARNSRKQVIAADVCEWNEEGQAVFKFKQKAKIRCKDGSVIDVKVAMFDAKGKPFKASIGNDSVIRISFTVNPYYMPTTKTVGLSLRPVAVQVIDLVEFNGGDAKSYGFDEEEGYEAESTEETPWESKDAPDEEFNRGDF